MKFRFDLTQKNKNHDIFFISDFHLFHANVLRFDKRPFNDVHEMHDYIVKKWNETVSENDVVFFLGDLSFAKSNEKQGVIDIINSLNGTIHFVLGNHDKFDEIKKLNRFSSINDLAQIRITHNLNDESVETSIECFHYPIYSWDKAHHGSIHLHGHTHGNLHHGETLDYYTNRRVMDVGCMLIDYTPISYKEVINKLIQ